MTGRTDARTLVLRPSAKINLTLRVGPRRPDGFHDVQTLLQSIDLHDTLRLTPHDGAFALASDCAGMPVDETNLVWRAADLLWRTLGRIGRAAGVRVELAKSIPMAAGLGGGSADAAAALVGLNQLWGGGLTRWAGRRSHIRNAVVDSRVPIPDSRCWQLRPFP